MKDSSTSLIVIDRGIRKGCSLAMLIFTMGITPILTECRAIKNADVTAEDDKYTNTSCLGYAYHLGLLTRDFKNAPNNDRQSL